jgi:hypothetical protein
VETTLPSNVGVVSFGVCVIKFPLICREKSWGLGVDQ